MQNQNMRIKLQQTFYQMAKTYLMPCMYKFINIYDTYVNNNINVAG